MLELGVQGASGADVKTAARSTRVSARIASGRTAAGYVRGQAGAVALGARMAACRA